ncbi:NADP-dependent oxidoreductase [Actinoplanes lobatus]|uniref:2-alkenal reductase n=1 Tax=Actinoplanes lobatus TaxID=113568 RepID=A0A7W7HIG1_9ACTN|nr:NADP-dependent oxidoreductase [Actinoplanes lobatus]MBB4751145.1 2-alkenal reductase [Actinoplanes lobatus]GGN94573.1 NADP-dependent oxidoreductase [Actinoplanes lobatus]GIE44641.1 NADP-dependent oxidoreductase [Actinoplanes lobatus]
MAPYEVRVATIPEGLPQPSDLAVVETPVPVAGAGEVLVRNRFFTIFAALRSLLGGVQGAPMPPFRVGDTLFGPAVGEVVTAPDDSGLRAGDLVQHMLGWRTYAVLPAGGWQLAGDELPDPVAHLSQGVTAYGALTRAAPVRPGDTVFVSGGAGSVGSMAGQVARLLGAARVIGSTGSAWKAERMPGYDAVVVRGAAPLAEQLAKAAPEGIDVVFDNVGGEDLRAALDLANPGARVALVGALSGQLDPDRNGSEAPVEIDTYRLILKRVSMAGYSAFGDSEVRTEWIPRFAGWLRDGVIDFPYHRVDGIGRAPQALHDVLTGRHLGTVVVTV